MDTNCLLFDYVNYILLTHPHVVLPVNNHLLSMLTQVVLFDKSCIRLKLSLFCLIFLWLDTLLVECTGYFLYDIGKRDSYMAPAWTPYTLHWIFAATRFQSGVKSILIFHKICFTRLFYNSLNIGFKFRHKASNLKGDGKSIPCSSAQLEFINTEKNGKRSPHW